MKAKLEFDLDNPDDRMAHLRCVKSLDMALAIFEIQNNLFKRLERIDHLDQNTISVARDFLNTELREINIDELIE